MNREYTSSDGRLVLRVEGEGGGCSIGFAGSAWHTHGDALVPTFGPTVAEAVEEYIREVLSDRLVIAVCPVGAAGEQAWITPRPEDEEEQKSIVPDLRLRYWSGREYGAPPPEDQSNRSGRSSSDRASSQR